MKINREVYKAKCKKTNEFVALKKVLTENEKEGVSFFNVFFFFNFKPGIIAFRGKMQYQSCFYLKCSNFHIF